MYLKVHIFFVTFQSTTQPTVCATRRISVSWQPWDFTKNQQFRKIRISFRNPEKYLWHVLKRRSYSPFNKRLADVNKQTYCTVIICLPWLMCQRRKTDMILFFKKFWMDSFEKAFWRNWQINVTNDWWFWQLEWNIILKIKIKNFYRYVYLFIIISYTHLLQNDWTHLVTLKEF